MKHCVYHSKFVGNHRPVVLHTCDLQVRKCCLMLFDPYLYVFYHDLTRLADSVAVLFCWLDLRLRLTFREGAELMWTSAQV